MLPSTTIFTIVSPIIIMTAIVIMSIGIMYRIREQILSSLGFLLLGLSFITGVLVLNKIDETLIIGYGWKYQFVKLLEAGIINPFKGPISPSYLQLGAWTGTTTLMLLTSLFLVLGATILSYIGVLMLGLDTRKASIVSAIILIIGIIGIYYLDKSISVLVINGDVTKSLSYRDLGGMIRGVSIIAAFALTTIGATSVYLETRTKDYLLYAVSFFLSGVGWTLFTTSWTTHFEKLSIFEFITTGTVKTPVTIYMIASVFIVIGAIGLLLASIIEIVSSTMAGAEEVFEEEIEETAEA